MVPRRPGPASALGPAGPSVRAAKRGTGPTPGQERSPSLLFPRAHSVAFCTMGDERRTGGSASHHPPCGGARSRLSLPTIMKFGIAYANAGPFGYPEPLAYLARTAEEVGIESIWTVEHVVIPVGYQSKYPYDPSGKIPGPENVPIPDPILPLAFAAPVTKRLRLAP